MNKKRASRKHRSDGISAQNDAWELDVPVSLSEDDTVNRVKMSAELGYHHIVLNFLVNVPKDNRPVRLPTQSAYKNLIKMLPESRNFELHSRLTLVAEDMSVARVLRDPGTAMFDLIALRPLSEQLLMSACEGHLPVDIVSFSVENWTPHTLRHSLLHASGLICEINYSPMIRDQSLRCSTISFAQVLTARSKGGGKGIFALSGEAHLPVELRPPADVANLASFLGLTARNGWASIVDAPLAAHRHALARRGIWGIKVLHPEPKDSDLPIKKKKTSVKNK